MELNPDDERVTPHSTLSRHVRRMRERQNLTLRSLAGRINFPYQYIHRVETGKQLPSDELAKTLDEFFGSCGLITDLLTLTRESTIPEYGRDIVNKEATADRIEVLTSTVIPGLFQTEDYARQVITMGQTWSSEEEVNTWLSIRMDRQRVFERATPVFFSTIMDEATLKRPIGGPENMADQLAQLLTMADSPYVSVQILPFACGAHPAPGGSATLLTLKDGSIVGYAEGVMVGNSVEAPADLLKLRRKFDVARSLALPEEESLGLVRHYVREYRDGESNPVARSSPARTVAKIQPQ